MKEWKITANNKKKNTYEFLKQQTGYSRRTENETLV